MPLLAIRCCYLCYMCCVIVIMLTAAISISTYLTFCFSQYDLVIENWKSDVLLQLRVSRDKCNKNEQQLILYTWPGTKSACDCRENTAWAIQYLLNERTPRKQIYVGDICNSTQRFYGCYSIYQTRIQQLKYFSDEDGQKFTFCAQYGYGQNYYPPNQECLKGNICGQKNRVSFVQNLISVPSMILGLVILQKVQFNKIMVFGFLDKAISIYLQLKYKLVRAKEFVQILNNYRQPKGEKILFQ